MMKEVFLRQLSLFVACLLSFSVLSLEAGSPAVDELLQSPAPGYLARIELNTPADLARALQRAEMLFLDGHLKGTLLPAVLVVHGPEVAFFFKSNYSANKKLVDLAAKLSAFNVVEIRVCETRMGVLGRDASELFPFVGTVPFGPAEIDRLIKEEKFVYF